jgi:hypothetical protein
VYTASLRFRRQFVTLTFIPLIDKEWSLRQQLIDQPSIDLISAIVFQPAPILSLCEIDA